MKLVCTWYRAMHVALAGAVLLFAGCTAGSDLPTSTPVAGIQVQGVQQGSRACKAPSNSDALVARVLDLVNLERQQRGLHTLKLNPVLAKAAEDYCCEMIENNFFSHDDPFTGKGPGQRAIDAGYIFLAMGENLAGGQASPEQVMNEWMNSPGHRENILAAQWEEVGIGVRTGGEYGVYWVQEFGNPP